MLERLPAKASDPAMAELRRLRSAMAASPADPALAARVAERYFELAMAEGDPRYVGYAEAALRSWRDEQATAEVLFMRGLLRQYRHDFAGGQKELAAALEKDPEHVGARAWRAAIFMVQADYAAAARECAALEAIASELLATGCGAYVEATTGKARVAYERLTAALKRHPEASAESRLWTLTRLAEVAWRLGDTSRAEQHFRDGLSIGLTDNFLLAAYADFLLEQGRPREVVALLKDWVRSDTLLLRLALAERAAKMPGAEQHVQALGDRFGAATLRGERLHMGEEARYLLDLKGNARAALEVAAENWKSQREPRDAEIFLRAAVVTGDRQAAAPVLRWLDETRFESPRLHNLAAKLR